MFACGGDICRGYYLLANELECVILVCGCLAEVEYEACFAVSFLVVMVAEMIA
jgi:hypothetical protein